MRVLIAGIGKTGSTALAYLLHRNLPGHQMAFEPRNLKVVAEHPDLICKYFLKRSDSGHSRLLSYDRIVLLVRHPFDTLVSYAMYAPYSGDGFIDDGNLNGYLELIGRKIRQTAAVSFRDVLGYCETQIGGTADFINKHAIVTEFAKKGQRRIFVLKYEDMIDRKLDALETYLGLQLRDTAEVPGQYARVHRTGGYGDWANWFDAEDLDYYSGIESLRHYLAHFGYPTTVPGKRSGAVDPELSIRYIVKLVNESRTRWRLPAFQPGAVTLSDPAGRLGRAVRAYRYRKNSDALAELRAAESAGITSPGIHFIRGLVHRRKKHFDLASAEFRRVLQSRPTDHHVLLLLAQSQLSAGETDDALAAAERAIAVEPSQSRGYRIASRAYKKLGLDDRAREAERKALELSPADRNTGENTGD